MAWSGSSFLGKWAKLYSNQTDAEKALEPAIAALGVPYRCQHPIWALSVFPDFVLLKQRVVIEVDDTSHNRAAKRRADAERTVKLSRAGWRVVRCTNDEALKDPKGTVAKLVTAAGHPELLAKGK